MYMHSKSNYPVVNNSTGTLDDFIHKTDVHIGHTFEQVIRRDRLGISELARRLDVSRRTIYNWFETQNLSFEIVFKVGRIIGHDFSQEFPQLFIYENQDLVDKNLNIPHKNDPDFSINPVYYWMDKYIKLLEKYNEILSHETKHE
jgi:DNA-binding XRE family transcriptional regulator